jgi:hypothetical protein
MLDDSTPYFGWPAPSYRVRRPAVNVGYSPVRPASPIKVTRFGSETLCGACNQEGDRSIQFIVFGTKVMCRSLRSVLQTFILGRGGFDRNKMLNVGNRRNGRCARWCALVTLLAVCSLTVSVATRYSSTAITPSSASTSVHKPGSTEPARQRLDNNAATWMPPLVVVTVLYVPSAHPAVTVTEPDISNPSFVSSLYHRPPPVSVSL